VLAVYYIAEQAKEGFISIDEIAKCTDIPKPYLSKILQDLCRGGILLSRRGTGGGFALTRSAQEINLRDIIEVIEGKIHLVSCLLAPSQCGNAKHCPIAPVWVGLQNFMLEILGNITIEDIIHGEKRQIILDSLETCRVMYREKLEEN
jgi:Rrf2 family protein